ncbi:MAG: signal recognition particle-docking protein FtsY [Candidatus Babeliales bacterium]
MLSFFKTTLSSLCTTFATPFKALFQAKTLDENILDQTKKILLSADTGASTTEAIISSIRSQWRKGTLVTGSDLQKAIHHELTSLLSSVAPHQDISSPAIILLVGVNGSGKTTTVAKLGNLFKTQGKKVLFAAADTFRAAATEQLEKWSTLTTIALVKDDPGADPASIAFKASDLMIKEAYDILIVDTAGRVQTKTNLMKQLEKIKRVINAKVPKVRLVTLLTVDSMLGQNVIDQVEQFNKATPLDGIIMTKMDGTGKGGILFAIADQFRLPVYYVTAGESLDAIDTFNYQQYVTRLFDAE